MGSAPQDRRPLTPEDASCDAAASALGELLRTARERRGLSLEQITRETKIPPRYLKALEHGDLDALPGGAYTRGEVIAFAAAVGVDKHAALDHLDRALHPPPPPQVPVAHSAPREAANHRPSFAMFALGALAIAAAAWAVREFATRPQQQVLVAQHAPTALPEPSSPKRDRVPVRQEAPAAAAAPQKSTTVPASSAAPAAAVARAAQTAPTPPASVAKAAVEDNTSEAARSETTSQSIPAPAAATAPTLTILTNPPGARVTVEGIGWGAAPVTIRNLTPGAKQVRVTLSGYSSVNRVVQIPESGSAKVVIPLQRQ